MRSGLWLRSTVPALVIATAYACGEGHDGSVEHNRTSVHAADGGSDAAAASSSTCRSDAGDRLVCDTSKVSLVPWGEPVTVRLGAGSPPAPEGGNIVEGGYQLVAETIYGSAAPNTDGPYPGAKVKQTVHVDCDVANELYLDASDMPSQIGAGNDCHRLVSRALDLLEVSGWMATSGPPLPDSRDQVSYTAKDGILTLISIVPYENPLGGILGSYTVVRDFVLLGAAKVSIPKRKLDTGEEERGASRDARCPRAAPSDGDPCTPDPAPLECEYGGDASGRCTTFAACVLDVDGTFRFRLDDATPCTPPNPAQCPSTFAEAATLTTQTHLPVCNYPEGVCGCSLAAECCPDACTWQCRAGSAVGSGCPWPRPLAGDPCQTGLTCNYDVACHGETSLGPSMICQHGHWAETGGVWFGCH